jgi:alkanesulfonate monooxygenase
MEIHWYLVPNDGPYPWHPKGQRLVDFGYLRQLATTVDHLGFDGALVAGGNSHDLWGLSFALIAYTESLKFIIAQHPGIATPMLLAQQALRSVLEGSPDHQYRQWRQRFWKSSWHLSQS